MMAELIDSPTFAKAVLPSGGQLARKVADAVAASDDNRDSPPAADEGDRNENRTDEEGDEAENGDDGAYYPAREEEANEDDKDDEADKDVLIIDGDSDDDTVASEKEANPVVLFSGPYKVSELKGKRVVPTNLNERKEMKASGRKPAPNPREVELTRRDKFLFKRRGEAKAADPYFDSQAVRRKAAQDWRVMSEEEKAEFGEDEGRADEETGAGVQVGGDGSADAAVAFGGGGGGDGVEMEEICAAGDGKENAAPDEGMATAAAATAGGRSSGSSDGGHSSGGSKKKSRRSSASATACGGGVKGKKRGSPYTEITPCARGGKKAKKQSQVDYEAILQELKLGVHANIDDAMNFAPAPSLSAGRRRRRRVLTQEEKEFAWTQYTRYLGDHVVNHRSLLHAHFECRGISKAGSGSYDAMAETLYLYDRGEIDVE